MYGASFTGTPRLPKSRDVIAIVGHSSPPDAHKRALSYSGENQIAYLMNGRWPGPHDRVHLSISIIYTSRADTTEHTQHYCLLYTTIYVVLRKQPIVELYISMALIVTTGFYTCMPRPHSTHDTTQAAMMHNIRWRC